MRPIGYYVATAYEITAFALLGSILVANLIVIPLWRLLS